MKGGATLPVFSPPLPDIRNCTINSQTDAVLGEAQPVGTAVQPNSQKQSPEVDRMSVNVNKSDGLTVVTVTSDPKCAWPPLCQILKALCYNPQCCSVSQHLRKVQGSFQSALGATQIMVGVINICLGAILGNNNHNYWQFVEDWYPVMLGLLFAAFGTMSVLSEKYPSPCLVIASVIANLAGVAFAIAAIILYGFNFLRTGLWWMCQRSDEEYWYGQHIQMPPVPSVEENIMMKKCMQAAAMVRVLLQSINAVLIIMSVLELCLVISSAVLGIKSLVRGQKEKNKSTDDPNLYKLPLLKEVATITA